MKKRQNYERKLVSSNNNSSNNLRSLADNNQNGLPFDESKFVDSTDTITSNDVSLTLTSSTNELCANDTAPSPTTIPKSGAITTNEASAEKVSMWQRVREAFANWQEERKYGRQKRIEGSEEIAYEIDRLSRIAFPSLFLAFNIIYWLTLLVQSNNLITESTNQ